MDGIEFKRAEAEDADIIYRLCIENVDKYEDTASFDDYGKVKDWIKRKINKFINEYVRIYKGGEVCGYYRVCKDKDEYELDDFYLLEGYRGQDIGTYIIKHILENNGGDFFLYVFKRNIPALKLYRKFGFNVREDLGTRYIMERKNGIS